MSLVIPFWIEPVDSSPGFQGFKQPGSGQSSAQARATRFKRSPYVVESSCLVVGIARVKEAQTDWNR